MTRPNLQVIRPFHEISNGLVQPMCRLVRDAHKTSGRFQKIGSAHITYKNKIARGHTHGFVGAATNVGDHETEMLRSVAWCVNRLELNFSNHEYVAIFEQLMVVTSAANFLVEPLVFPIGVAFVAYKNFRSFFRQLARARNKVCVDVRFGHGNNT